MTESPAYERVANQLRDAILKGELVERLPTLAGLGERYGVTPDVARRAVEILRSEGLVVTRQGSGSYVRRFERITRSSPSRLSRSRWGVAKGIQDADAGGSSRAVDIVVTERPAPDDIATVLGVGPGKPVLTRSRRYLVEERPVQLSISYLPLDVVAGSRIAYTNVGPGGTYARLAELGYEPVRFVERLTVRAPRPEEVDRLGLASSVGAGVVQIVREAYTEAERCVEVNQMVLDAAAYQLEYHFTA